MSKKWQRKREEVIARAGGMCERCHENFGRHVHHLFYGKVRGDEPLHWLQLVCLDCHGLYHPERDFVKSDRERRENWANRKSKSKKSKRKPGRHRGGKPWSRQEAYARKALVDAAKEFNR